MTAAPTMYVPVYELAIATYLYALSSIVLKWNRDMHAGRLLRRRQDEALVNLGKKLENIKL